MEDKTSVSGLVPRLCHIVRWPDFNGYGFNLHAEKGKAGQFIGKVDTGSPAEAAGLRDGDRIVEVNGINIGNENHQQVVGRVKSGGDETRLLVVDPQTDMHYKSTMTVVRGDLPEVCFMTASRDAHTKSTLTNNGTAALEQPSGGDSAVPAAASPHYPVRLCQLCKWDDFDGYGFNLHAEKDKPGQFIGVVDRHSPAERGGLREGDRIVEVNGDNIESLNHASVIQRVKAGGGHTELLVVDREADAYYKGVGIAVSSKMVGVTVIATPPTSKIGESEAVTAAVAEAVESAPPPPPPPAEEALQQEESVVANGHEEEKEEEEEAEKEKEEVVETVEMSTVEVTLAAATINDDDAVETKKEEEEEEEKVEEEGEKVAAAAAAEEEDEDEEAMGDLNAYEQVEVVAAVSCYQSPPPAATEDEDLESEAVTAAVAEAVESAPPPPPPPAEEALQQEESVVANGHEEEKEEEEEAEKEKEEVVETVEMSTVEVTLAAATINDDDAVETKKEEEEEEEKVEEEGEKVAAAAAAEEEDEDEEAMGDLNAYEQVEVVAAVSCYQSPPPAATEDEDLGPSSYGMNGGATVPEPEPEPTPAEPEPEPRPVAPQPPSPVARAPEPEPEPVAVIPSKVKAGPAMGGGLELHLSAAEMKERLKARKKQDPRFHKTSFEAKSRMFEKL